VCSGPGAQEEALRLAGEGNHRRLAEVLGDDDLGLLGQEGVAIRVNASGEHDERSSIGRHGAG
jgi:hypothetical protein